MWFVYLPLLLHCSPGGIRWFSLNLSRVPRDASGCDWLTNIWLLFFFFNPFKSCRCGVTCLFLLSLYFCLMLLLFWGFHCQCWSLVKLDKQSKRFSWQNKCAFSVQINVLMQKILFCSQAKWCPQVILSQSQYLFTQSLVNTWSDCYIYMWPWCSCSSAHTQPRADLLQTGYK